MVMTFLALFLILHSFQQCQTVEEFQVRSQMLPPEPEGPSNGLSPSETRQCCQKGGNQCCCIATAGIPGIPGQTGSKGNKGDFGDIGRPGRRGPKGEVGQKGDKGEPAGGFVQSAPGSLSSGRLQRVAFFATAPEPQGPLSQHNATAFKDVRLNAGRGYNEYSYKFVAPLGGIYAFFVTLRAQTAGAGLTAFIMHGSYHAVALYASFQDGGSVANYVAQLKGGDEVYVLLYRGSSIAGEYSTFSGYLLFADDTPLAEGPYANPESSSSFRQPLENGNQLMPLDFF